jgi:hypothetical protein
LQQLGSQLVFQYQTRRYFEMILGVYFLFLGAISPFVLLPKSGRPLVLHYLFELIFICMATFFLVRSSRPITVVLVAGPQHIA